jgi:hypothetical protein
MWTMIPSLVAIVQALAPAFTDPSFATYCQLLLGWLMCPGNHNTYRVGQTIPAITTSSVAPPGPSPAWPIGSRS